MTDDPKTKEEQQFNELIQVFVEQRLALLQMITDLEEIKKKIDKILPEGVLDKRYIRFFEEKVKSITELFRTMLDLRKEITKNAKDEFDLRKRNISEESSDYADVFDIQQIARKVELFRSKKEEVEKKIEGVLLKEKENVSNEK